MRVLPKRKTSKSHWGCSMREGDHRVPHSPGVPAILQTLTEEARRPWCKILVEQIDVTPWSDLYGVEHAEKHHRSWQSFKYCMTFHLLLVFRSDAAETQYFYISTGLKLKKPNRVPIRQFVQRVQQLNGYLHLLPCLFYSDAQPSSPRRWNRSMMLT